MRGAFFRFCCALEGNLSRVCYETMNILVKEKNNKMTEFLRLAKELSEFL